MDGGRYVFGLLSIVYRLSSIVYWSCILHPRLISLTGMFWGGLRPILSQLLVDFWTILSFAYVIFSKPTRASVLFLAIVSVLSICFSGNSLTNRWTVTFTLLPVLMMQTFRLLLFRSSQKREEKPTRCEKVFSFTIGASSFILVITALTLSVLFPAVELPLKIPSNFKVGVIDLFLPAEIEFVTSIEQDLHEPLREKAVDHLTVRILYPTEDERVIPVPQLEAENSKAFCEESMRYAAPPPLRSFAWILHTWRLARIPATRNAQPADRESPIIAFSHGLGGNADIYTYQTISLAAKGYTVIMVEHSDGSAPVVSRQDASKIRRNVTVEVDWREGRKERYRRSRRAMVEFRAEELLAAVKSMISLNLENIPALESIGISFVGKLDTSEIHYMGHSFGGATALHASLARTPTSIIAYDPVSGWLPDQTRFTLYNAERMEGSALNYTYYWVDAEELERTGTTDLTGPSVHNTNMLILFSHEWHSNDWEGTKLLDDMYQRGRLGPEGGISRLKVIDGAHHMEFSDSQMLTPVWLARGGGSTGLRNPLDTAWDIHVETSTFLQDLKLL